MKKIYGFHFAGFWVDQRTRVIIGMGEDDGFYSPVLVGPDGGLVPTEYAVASGPKAARAMFFRYFDFVRKKVDPTRQLVLACEPTIVEYSLEDVLATPCVRKAVSESCMADYYGWNGDNLAAELTNAVQGKDRYVELF